jgi:HEAT repeat protein
MTSDRTLAEQTRRRREAALAGHRGDVTTAATLLADDDPVVRATALRALARASAIEIGVLVTQANDPAPTMRTAVAGVVAATRGGTEPEDTALDDVLLLLLADTDATVVEIAAWAAGERERAVDPVIERLAELTTGHDAALVREAAVAALGAIGDRRGLGAILAATTDKATVRRRAVLALAPFDGPDVHSALERALDDRDWQVRQAAEDLIS